MDKILNFETQTSSSMFYGLPTDGTLTYNCVYEDAWNNLFIIFYNIIS